MEHLKQMIDEAWENRSLLREEIVQQTIREVIHLLDLGQLRVAEPTADGWKVNEWVKKAVVLYFPIQNMKPVEVVSLSFTIRFHSNTTTTRKECA